MLFRRSRLSAIVALTVGGLVACAGTDSGGGEGDGSDAADGQDGSDSADSTDSSDGSADSGGSDSEDGTDGSDGSGSCTPGAGRCDEQVAHTCNSAGTAEESLDCVAEGLECKEGACRSKPVSCVAIRPIELRTGTPATAAVAVVFAVNDCDGAPVIGLSIDKFEIREDGDAVSPSESSSTILQRQAEVFISLVLDNSPSVKSAGALDKAVDAAKEYAATVLDGTGGRVRVGVSFFSDALVNKLAPTSDVAAVLDVLESLRTDATGTNTTNLYGSLVELLDASAALQKARRAEMNGGVTTLGQVVVFTDGADKFKFKTLSEAKDAVAASPDDVIFVALGGEVEPDVINALGRDGAFIAESADGLGSAFADAASRLGHSRSASTCWATARRSVGARTI